MTDYLVKRSEDERLFSKLIYELCYALTND
jgi:hypothetical protein